MKISKIFKIDGNKESLKKLIKSKLEEPELESKLKESILILKERKKSGGDLPEKFNLLMNNHLELINISKIMIEHYFTAKDLSKVNNTVAADQIENYGITVTTTPIEYDAEPMEKAISELCNKLEDTLLYGSNSKDNKDIGSSDQPFEEKRDSMLLYHEKKCRNYLLL